MKETGKKYDFSFRYISAVCMLFSLHHMSSDTVCFGAIDNAASSD